MNALILALYFAVCVGAAYFYGGFVKIKIGPLYILEAIVGFGFVSALLSFLFYKKGEVRKLVRELISMLGDFRKPLLPTFLLFLLGLVTFAFDLLSRRHGYDISTQRIAQHGLIAFYPMIWITAGIWLGSRERIATDTVCWVVFLCAFAANLQGMLTFNFSLGPLVALSVMVTWNEIFREKKKGKLKIFVALVLTFILFFPYLTLWSEKMQRTSLVALVFSVISVPILLEFNSRKPKWIAAVQASTLVLTLFAVLSTLIVVRHAGSLNEGFVQALQKGEDSPLNTPQAPSQAAFQQRFRRYVWNQTLLAWKESPILGVGFVREIPAYIRDGVKNDGDFLKYPDTKFLPLVPISGPHNSYLNMLARLGLVGFALLFWILIAQVFVWKDVLFRQKLTLADLILLFVPINGLIYALFNNGFEAPHNSVLLWLFFGIVSGLSLKKRLQP